MRKSEDEQLRHANMYYESIRNRKSKSDVNTIAKNTNMPKEKINAIREHIFYSNSNKTLSGEFKPFDADIDIALAWQRLEQNKFTDIDIILLNHEYLELSIMKEYNYDYKKAHFIADLDYPWEFYTKRHLKEVPRDNIYPFIQNILKSLL